MKFPSAIVLGLFIFAVSTHAQQGPPEEAPYVQEEKEFDSPATTAKAEAAEAQQVENELSQTISEVTPPPPSVPISNKTTKAPKGGMKYIRHPQADKGLVLITKEGAYVYKTDDERAYKQSGTFRVGMMDAPKIRAADGQTNFSQMYSGGQVPVFNFEFDWQPFETFGRLAIEAGLGVIYASGSGRFVVDGSKAREKYTFFALPLSLGFNYRLELWHRQWAAPYVSGGGTYIGVGEVRDDGAPPKFVGTPAAYGGGGLLFNISAIHRDTAFALRSEYGIQNLWLALDAKYVASFSKDLDFSSTLFGVGLTCDY